MTLLPEWGMFISIDKLHSICRAHFRTGMIRLGTASDDRSVNLIYLSLVPQEFTGILGIMS